MNQSDDDNDPLYRAFRAVYLDCVGHGIVPYDERVLWRMWAEFVHDMSMGFPSLWERRHDDA